MLDAWQVWRHVWSKEGGQTSVGALMYCLTRRYGQQRPAASLDRWMIGRADVSCPVVDRYLMLRTTSAQPCSAVHPIYSILWRGHTAMSLDGIPGRRADDRLRWAPRSNHTYTSHHVVGWLGRSALNPGRPGASRCNVPYLFIARRCGTILMQGTSVGPPTRLGLLCSYCPVT